MRRGTARFGPEQISIQSYRSIIANHLQPWLLTQVLEALPIDFMREQHVLDVALSEGRRPLFSAAGHDQTSDCGLIRVFQRWRDAWNLEIPTRDHRYREKGRSWVQDDAI